MRKSPVIPASYSVLYILNQKYAELALMSIRSLLDGADGSRLARILVADIGLRRDTARLLRKLSPRVEVVPTGVWVGDSQRRHSRYWTEAVSLKTRILRQLVARERNLPLVLLDTDTVITADFSPLLDASLDLQICRRHVPAERDDMTMHYIASFIAVHSVRALGFIDAWIERLVERMAVGTTAPFETPALCQVVDEWAGRINIGELDELAVSSPNCWVENKTCIIHMKNEGAPDGRALALSRIEAVRDYPQASLLRIYQAIPHTEPDFLERAVRRLSRIAGRWTGAALLR
ncbi:MAG: hypothetical protein RL434_2752 [Pseudomonadota bacterium]|jgi:hypothetical protein